MGLVIIFKRFKKYQNKYGIKKTIHKIVNIFLTCFVSTRFVYILDLIDLKKIFRSEKHIIKEAINSDIDIMYSNYSNEISNKRLRFLKKSVEDPDIICLLVLNKEGDICGYGCLALGKAKYSKIFKKINSVEIKKNGYFHRDYTFNRYRRQGVQKVLIGGRLNILKNKDFKTATTRIAVGNIASEHCYKKYGFRKVLKEIHFHFFNLFPETNYFVKVL